MFNIQLYTTTDLFTTSTGSVNDVCTLGLLYIAMQVLLTSQLYCFGVLQNYMIPLKQVLSPPDMESIFVNLEVSADECNRSVSMELMEVMEVTC